MDQVFRLVITRDDSTQLTPEEIKEVIQEGFDFLDYWVMPSEIVVTKL